MNTFMPSGHNLLVVAASFGIAMLASYVTLDLARRVRSTQRRLGLVWWGAGSLVMGTGIWAMHFLGMQAFELPIAIGFGGGLTLLSWLAAVGAAGVALGLASREQFGRAQLALGALVMGAGISGMHYIGMAAMDMAPGIVWDPWMVALSVLIAVLASAVALTLFKLLRQVKPSQRLGYQLAASFVMAVAICGMHYTGMGAAQFAVGSVCRSAGELGGPGLTVLVLVATGMLLISTLFTSILDARLQSTAERLTDSLLESNLRLKAANDELQHRAFSDPLTGLPNRLLFEDRLRQALLRLERSNHDAVVDRLAVLFIDLDGFKPINDSFGHAAGDVILRCAADRLRLEAREGDTVARVGGDEFLLLLENVADEAACVIVAERALTALSKPFELSGRQVQIACSIGIAIHPGAGERSKLVANADAAMYAAKRAGGSCHVLFEPHMGSDASTQLELQNDLRLARERGELSLHYQPKIDGQDGQICGVEALLRWNHPHHGMVSPTVFIALAERFGLIGQLGNWVIDEACRQIAEWRKSGANMRVAINISAHQLRGNSLVTRIEQAMAQHGVAASQLLCEITETVAMEDMKATQRTFDGLARIGVFLSIDDFGSGYSSLNYLRQLPARQLKIDRSFVNDLEFSEDARSVVNAVVKLAHALNLRVVAEGVETAGQRDILLAMHCDELQGYFFARPMPADALLAWSEGEQAKGLLDNAPSRLGGPLG
ncbi:MAG: EAL domain-containing protein [Comamonas sp.]